MIVAYFGGEIKVGDNPGSVQSGHIKKREVRSQMSEFQGVACGEILKIVNHTLPGKKRGGGLKTSYTKTRTLPYSTVRFIIFRYVHSLCVTKIS